LSKFYIVLFGNNPSKIYRSEAKMKRLASVLAIILIFLLSCSAYAQNNTLPYLRSIVLSDSGLYAAVGDAGLIITSEDGVVWNKAVSASSENINGVVWAMGKFIAAGNKGTLITSANGRDWTKADISAKEIDLNSVASSGNEIVAAGDSGTVLVSKDGVLWAQRRMATKEKIYRVRWINDRYFAVGEPMLILTSKDGITWDEVKAEPSSAVLLTDIVWDGKKYVAVGEQCNMWISEDGRKWIRNEAVLNKEEIDNTQNIYSITWTGSKFVAVGDRGKVLSSADGSDWKREDSATNKDLKDIVYSDGKYVVTGEKGVILTSGDGVKWNNHYSISAQSNNITLKQGQKKSLEIMLNYPYGESEDVTAETSFEVLDGFDVLTVEKNGEMNAIGVGKALVKATYDTKSIEISVSVEKDADLQSPADDPNQGRDNGQSESGMSLSNILLLAGSGIIVAALILGAILLIKKKKV